MHGFPSIRQLLCPLSASHALCKAEQATALQDLDAQAAMHLFRTKNL